MKTLQLSPRHNRPVSAALMIVALLFALAAAAPASAASSFNIHNVNASGKCIGIATSGLAGDWNCTSNADQMWSEKNTDGYGFYQLVNDSGNGKCLSGGSATQGTDVYATTCNTGDLAQFWYFDQGGYIVNAEAYLAGSEMVIGVYGGSTANGAALVDWPPVSHTDQYWY